ncbi:MAG TPA: type II toxin-antitoxin system PemK/MazF family toxin [Candidatus Nanoarchaeia archaeon]|nr:type II toxin-antitoxin system PemK/MazF family toxin [Candidatus Nanoarchaeia archaeon]
MERPVIYEKGDIVIFNFPFSNSLETKKRPSLIVAKLSGEDVILCQITSQPRPDPDIITLAQKDFQSGGIKRESYLRPSILFTIHSSRISYKAGRLKQAKIKEVEKKLCEIFTR